MDQRSGDGWISGWSQIFAFYHRNSWSKLWVTRRENCFSTEQNHPEYPLQEKGQSGGNESSQRRPLPPRKTECLPDLRILPCHWGNDSVENYADLFTVVLRNDDIQEFDSKWDDIGLSRTQIPSDDILEGLYKLRIGESEKLKTVLELYDLEIRQKKAGPDYHRLKTMVKRSIEQNLRMKKLEARNENYERNAVFKNQRVKKREQRNLGDCWQWKANGQCSKGDNCSFRHDINKRAKSTQPNSSPKSSTRQSERNASRTRSPRGKSESGRMSRWPCKDYLKGTCTTPFCEKWHPPECLFYKSENGCRFGEKCSYPHRQVDEQPSKRSKNNGDKSAVAMLKKNEYHHRTGRPVGCSSSNTRQLGCVFQDLEPPKSSSILRKSSSILKPIRCVKYTKAVVRRADIRDQNPPLGMICPGEPHQRNPNAPKFEDRSREETEWQERCAREAAWRLAKNIQKLKEKQKSAFFSPSGNWCLPAPPTLKPEEREFVVDSGASMHMIRKKDLSDAEMDTLSKSCSPTIVITANGEVQTHEEATVYVKELDIFLTRKVLEDTPAVLSIGKLCDEHGYSYEWINGQKPHLIKKRDSDTVQNGELRSYRGSWFINEFFLKPCQLQHPWHLQGRNLIIPSLPQACLPQHLWHLQRRLIIQITLQQSCQAKVWIDKNGETRMGRITIPQSCQAKVWIDKNGETRTLLKIQKSCWINQPKHQNKINMIITSENEKTPIIPIYRNGCKNSERIWWMTEFLKAETHTRVLLMDYL